MADQNWIDATVPFVLSELHRLAGWEKAELKLFANGTYEMEPPIMSLFPAQMGITIPATSGTLPTPANVTLFEDGTYSLEYVTPRL